MDVISLADDKVIKQIEFKTQPDEIIIDLKIILRMLQVVRIAAYML